MSASCFLGGSTTSFHITNPYIQEQVRHTEDVDVIISILSKNNWYDFCEQLRQRSFKQSSQDSIICRFRLDQLIVDVMPENPEILGFSNPWYSAAIANTQALELEHGVTINLVTPCYFLATKFAAFQGRGNNDLLSSHDIEEILNVIDGRLCIEQEIKDCISDVKTFIGKNVLLLIEHQDISSLLQSHTHGDDEKISMLYQRLKTIAKLAC